MQHQWNSAGEQFLICEFELDGEQCSGSLHEFDTSNLIVDTDVPLSTGSEIEVQLIRSPALPVIWLNVSVAEELALPAATQMQHRFLLQILSLPPEYLIAVGAYAQGCTRDTDTNEHSQPRSSSRAHMKSGEAEWARTLNPGSERSPRKRRRKQVFFAAPVEQIRARELPAVVVIDSGELDDVVVLLEEHGVEFVRTTVRDVSNLGGWTLPRCLLVTTPRLALALRIPRHGAAKNLVSIAIGEIDSATLRREIQLIGFQYLVSRPVHPEALRLLLLQAVYRGRDRRESRRLTIGCDVKWSMGWLRRRDPMLEVSMNGCRLLTDSEVPIGPRVKIRVPPAKAGRRGIALRGHIVRCESVDTSGERVRFAVSVAFDQLRDKAACELEHLLALRATGPATLDRRRWTPPRAPAPNPTQIEAPDGVPAEPEGTDFASGESENVATSESPDPGASDAPLCETAGRRRVPRRMFSGEIVALAPDVDRVIHTLVGRDLSRDGLRVEAHPLIALGDQIRVGLYDGYDDSTGEPLVVNAVVARDDGLSGLWLRFESTDAATLEQIELHIKTLTPIESLHANDGEASAESVVFADLFETEVPDVEDSPSR